MPLMSLRVSESDGSGTRLPDGAELRGLQLVFQGFHGAEARYQGTAAGRNYLVREVSLQNDAALQAMRSEARLIKSLSLPVLPELCEAFQEAAETSRDFDPPPNPMWIGDFGCNVNRFDSRAASPGNRCPPKNWPG